MVFLPYEYREVKMYNENLPRSFFWVLELIQPLSIMLRGTFKSKAPLRVQFSLALGGRGWERVKAEASPRLY